MGEAVGLMQLCYSIGQGRKGIDLDLGEQSVSTLDLMVGNSGGLLEAMPLTLLRTGSGE